MPANEAVTAREYRRGLVFALVSVALVSVAQLALKFGVSQVATDALREAAGAGRWLDALVAFAAPSAWLPLGLGIGCYGASVLCWLAALGRLPLNLAYPLLSLSYPLVYAGAALLPFFDEALNAWRIGGIALIMLGVALLMTGRDS